MSKKKIIICIIIFAIITIIAILLTNSVIGYIKDKKKIPLLVGCLNYSC